MKVQTIVVLFLKVDPNPGIYPRHQILYNFTLKLCKMHLDNKHYTLHISMYTLFYSWNTIMEATSAFSIITSWLQEPQWIFLFLFSFMEVWFLLVLWTKPGACAYEASTLPLNYTPKLFFSWQGLLRLPRLTLNLRSSCVSLSTWDYSPVLAGPVALFDGLH